MSLLKVVAVVALSACGIEPSKVNYLTDNKTILVFQQLTDGYRLLSCQHTVNLQIDERCVNVFLTADGAGEYLFSDTPQQPRLFVPTADTIRKLTYVPIVVGGALLTYLVVRKIRVKQQTTTTIPWKIASNEGEKFARFQNDLPSSVKKYLEGNKQWRPTKLTRKPTETSLNDLADGKLFNNGQQSASDLLTNTHQEISALDKTLQKAIAGFEPDQQAFIKKSFAELQQKYGENGEVAKVLESYRRDDRYLSKKQAERFVGIFKGDLSRSDELISHFWQLFGDTSSANKARRRAVIDISTKGTFADYVIAGITGLLAGSYLPRLLPDFSSYFLTAAEWQALFGDKKIYKVGDNRRVIKKLARYLQNHGEPVIVNDHLMKTS